MYVASRSDCAERVLANFTRPQARQYREIEYLLCRFLALNLKHSRGRLVSPCTYYDMDGYRYFDNDFPFIIFFELGSADDYGQDTLLIQAILAAIVRPPTQVRI